MIIIKILIIYWANLNERLMKLCRAEMIVKFSLSVTFSSSKRSLSVFRGWNARVAWNKFIRISEYLEQLKKKCSASSIALQTGLGQRWLLNKSWFKVLQLLRIRACCTDNHLSPWKSKDETLKPLGCNFFYIFFKTRKTKRRANIIPKRIP